MATLYPEIEPFESLMLPVGDGNVLSCEISGNASGKPVIVVHGGPGSGSSARSRRYFDPACYRIIQFDQRGCGRSSPHAGDPDTDMALNTTAHLLADMKTLMAHLGIERAVFFGVSWGVTLCLAFAQTHPGMVEALILAGVTTTRRSEIDWLYRGLAPLFPAQWDRFRAGVPADRREDDLVEAYHQLLNAEDAGVRDKGAADWHDWEAATILIDPDARLSQKWDDPRYRLARARIITHYFRNAAWLDDGVLLRKAHRLAGIPGVMIQGRLDLEAPLVTAWELAKVWPDGELLIIDRAGHSPAAPGMSAAIVAAADRFR